VPIPHTLHRIWVGPDPLPDEFAAYGEAWARLHPSWELRLWTEDNLPRDLERAEALDRYRIPAERADVLRYELLWRHGGLYADTDIEPLRPFDDLLAAHRFFTGEMKPGRVNNALIASTPGHPLMETAMREASLPVYEDPAAPPPLSKEAHGPLFFGSVVARFPDATVFPPQMFYPNTDAERREAYARHYAVRSWGAFDDPAVEIAKLRDQLDKAERRLEKSEERLARTRAQRDALQLELARSPATQLRQALAGRFGHLPPARLRRLVGSRARR